MRQVRLKIESDSLDLIAAQTKLEIAQNQLVRIQSLFDDGIKSLTDLEAKKLSVREAQAKTLSLENKIFANRNDLLNLKANIIAITNDYNDKLSKSQSERMSAISNKYNAGATKNKLESSYNAYEQRANNYYVTAPVTGLITKAVVGGIGEVVKEGEDILTIIPSDYQLVLWFSLMDGPQSSLVDGRIALLEHLQVKFLLSIITLVKMENIEFLFQKLQMRLHGHKKFE